MKGLLSEEEELRRFNAAQGGEQPWYAKALPMEGRATILPFRDTMPGSVFNKREFALPGLLAEAVNAFTSPARALLGTDADFYPEKEAANMALNLFGGGITTGKALRNPTGVGGTDLALNVWHGSPHNIEGKFDIAKVGTGEGNQSYGHGMYYGGVRETAEQYLAPGRHSHIVDKLIDGIPAKTWMEQSSDPIQKRAADAISRNPSTKDAISYLEQDALFDPLAKKAVEWINSNESKIKTPGYLYKVDIPDAAIPMMLDWDKPVSKELLARITPENLGLKVKQFDDGLGYVTDAGVLVTRVKQGKAKEVTEEMLKNSFNDSLNRYSNSGQNLYGWLVPGNAPAASQILSNAGITGIKYLDEGSRAAGKGTSNYVVFDPSTVKILEKNDIKIEDLIEKGLLGD